MCACQFAYPVIFVAPGGLEPPSRTFKGWYPALDDRAMSQSFRTHDIPTYWVVTTLNGCKRILFHTSVTEYCYDTSRCPSRART